MPKYVYIEMTNREVEKLPRKKTVFLSAISPLEVHGPHLPIGTDIFIAETLRDRVAEALLEKNPQLHCVYLPTLPLGAEAIPVPGSFKLHYSAIERTLLDWGRSLQEQGFCVWALMDNHGGPHHQLAISAASQKLARKGFHLVAPFNYVFRQMVALSEEMRTATGLDAGNCGDVSDMHAGTNETSLMRATHPEMIRDIWEKMGPGRKSPVKPFHQLILNTGKLFEKLGMKEAATDFFFLGSALSWVSDQAMEAYQGDPSASDPAAGEAMLDYHASVAAGFVGQALEGRPPVIHPLGRSIRFIRRFV